MSEPLVSAVIITHNRKDYVLKAIKSVQSQTYSNIEIIVVDDASQDGTKELLEKIATKDNILYIYISKDESKGGNHARNIGILASNAEYVAFLDDDDEWFPEKIYKQVNYMQDHPECGVVSCFRIIELNFKSRYPDGKMNFLEGDVHTQIFTRIPFVTSEAMYKKSVLIKAGLFDEELKYWQETELNIRVAQLAQFGCVQEELILYRIIDSDKNRLTNHLDGWIKAIDYIEDKHSLLINKLSEDDLKKHKLLIASDGAERSFRVGNKKLERSFRKQTYQIDPNLINFFRLIFPYKWFLKLYFIKNSIFKNISN